MDSKQAIYGSAGEALAKSLGFLPLTDQNRERCFVLAADIGLIDIGPAPESITRLWYRNGVPNLYQAVRESPETVLAHMADTKGCPLLAKSAS